jgi:hypothetical protein
MNCYVILFFLDGNELFKRTLCWENLILFLRNFIAIPVRALH